MSDKTETYLEERAFLRPGASLDAVAASIIGETWEGQGETGSSPREHLTASFVLSEETQGHFCLQADEERLEEIREAVAIIRQHADLFIATVDQILETRRMGRP